MTINIITLKHGTLYDSDYVNIMFNMFSRNLTLPFKFFCMTDDATNIDNKINIIELPNNELKGWWLKVYAFKENLFSTDSNDINLFIDLDMIIIDNIDCYFNHLKDSNKLIGLRDLIYLKTPHIVRLGSAVMRWPNNQYNKIWELLDNDRSTITDLAGDQDYIWKYFKNDIDFFPKEWSNSYKWEYRLRGIRGGENMIVFHGTPNPHQMTDPFLVDKWQ